MRTTISFFIICLLSILLFSCKEEEQKFVAPESGRYFNGFIDSYEKTIIDGQNAYKYVHSDSCATTDDLTLWFGGGILKQGSSGYFMNNKECFGIRLHNFSDDKIDRDAFITNYFKSPVPFAFIDTLTGNLSNYYGIEIQWIDKLGDLYTTLFAQQTGTVSVTKFQMSMENARILTLDLSFACQLVNKDLKRTISLLEGTARMTLYTTCY